jgi:F-type H+-transporting ATPase subunit epsilon
MPDKNKLTLKIISQEKKLLEEVVDQVTLPSGEGELTILPKHAALFAQIETGEIRFSVNGREQDVVVSKGFVDVNPSGEVTILVDSAIQARDISIEKAQAAVAAAKETMSHTTDQREMLLAEASLKQAMWEIRVAQKTSKARI